MNSDLDWIRWGERDPYFAVITDPRYRSDRLTEDARRDFFETGRWHARHVLEACKRMLGASFAPQRALDFGCGVGRVALPLAGLVEQVTAIDVSPAMLEEGRRNARAQGIGNIEWQLSDDTLSAVQGVFDLVHSCITFQHIDIVRGRVLFGRLLELLAPGGAGAIQITYAKSRHADSFGQPPQATLQPPRSVQGADPAMQMNAYNLGELAFVMQTAGIRRFQAEFTDHGGELGVFLYFGREGSTRNG